jgi:hypothetical protein
MFSLTSAELMYSIPRLSLLNTLGAELLKSTKSDDVCDPILVPVPCSQHCGLGSFCAADRSSSHLHFSLIRSTSPEL